VILAGESLRTELAPKRSLAGVLPDVVDQMLLPGEGLGAEVAPVR